MVGSSDAEIIATIMVGYACSTIVTGIVFLILGIFKLGNVIQFFPRHILVGCIGGIGLFLIFTAIEVTSHVPPIINMNYLFEIFKLRNFVLWFSSLLVAIFLKVLQNFFNHQMLVPLFYASLPIIFYTIVYALGIPLDALRSTGWLFKFQGQQDVPFYVFWTYFDFFKVNWAAVSATIPTQLALTFFGILHVPINGLSCNFNVLTM
jgi:MFS superfamily sulfate permease-like transporter